MLAEHVPHGAQLPEKLRIDVLSRNRIVLEAFAHVRRLAVVLTIVVKVIVLLYQGMTPNLVESDAAIWVDLKHSPNEILGFGAEMPWHFILPLLCLIHHDSDVWIVEWQGCSQHGVQDDTQAPDIGPIPSVLTILEKLRGRVVRTATGCRQLMRVSLVERCHSKVGNLDAVIGCDEDVFGLEVAMAYVE